MLRTLFTVGLIAMLGLVALKLVFGLLGPLVGLLFMLLGFAIRVILIGAVIYFVIRVVSPAPALKGGSSPPSSAVNSNRAMSAAISSRRLRLTGNTGGSPAAAGSAAPGPRFGPRPAAPVLRAASAARDSARCLRRG